VTAKPPRPTEVLEGHIGYLLSKLGSLAASRFDGELAPFGINRVHFGLLKIVEAAGPSSQHVLSRDLGMPPSRMVAIVDELEAQGFVVRQRSASDRRVNVVGLTSAGQAVLTVAETAAHQWEDQLLADLTGAERVQLHTLLQRVAAGQRRAISSMPDASAH
jgi:DNA-binding MarR family transcriptional regulator